MTSEPRAYRFDKHGITVAARLARQWIVDRKLPLPLRILPFRAATEVQHTRLATAPRRTQARALLEEIHVLHVKLHVVQRIELDAALQQREREIEDELIAPLHFAVSINPRTRLRHRAYRTVERAQRGLVTGKEAIVHYE